jgi:HK97 gp10 family phage protein
MDLQTTFRGLADLERTLDELPVKIERNIVRGALRAGGQVFQAEAQRRVPVRSGRLRDSIRVSVRIRRGLPMATIRAGGRGKGSAWYAHLVEFGTAQHFIKPRDRKSLLIAGLLREVVDHPGAKKSPFMRPALDAAAAPAVRAFATYAARRLTKTGINTPDPLGYLDQPET